MREGVDVMASPGVCDVELLELTRDMAVVFFVFFDGVDGCTDLDTSATRGFFNACVSERSLSPLAGRFLEGACCPVPLELEGLCGSLRDEVMASILLMSCRSRLGTLKVNK